MNEIYKDICSLFKLNEPAPLTDAEIADIRAYFGGIPGSLETYYKLCGGCENMNSAQDYLLTADNRYGYDLKNWLFDDYCVFYVENQCVSVWAFRKSDIDKYDPPVYESSDNGENWFKTCERLSQFLISHAYLHAVFSFEYSSEEFLEADSSQVKKIEESFPHANADSALFTGVKFYQPYPDTVIVVMNNDEVYSMVMLSSENEDHFDETADILYDILGLE